MTPEPSEFKTVNGKSMVKITPYHATSISTQDMFGSFIDSTKSFLYILNVSFYLT